MIDNLRRFEGAKIIVGHEIEMGFDFFAEISRQADCHCAPERVTFDFDLLVIRLLISEVLRGGVKELPHERFLPVRPCFRARALAIGQRK